MGRGGFEPPKALGQLIYSQSRLTTSVSARPRNFTENGEMPRRRLIMWQGLVAPSLERLIVTPRDNGFELSGLILQAHREVPYVVRYRIALDASWITCSVELEVDNGGHRGVRLDRDSTGQWSLDGKRRSEFDGCADVDIEWSPSTNTLPIRRLDQPPGTTTWLTAVWIRLPWLSVEPLEQSYERLTKRRYRYRAGDFTADLEVDAEGWVRQYGVIWKAVATSG